MNYDKVQDSGKREEFSTGSVRDIQAGKGRFDLIPYESMRRLAVHFENGAAKYGDGNWQKGQPAHVYVNSCMRHMGKYQDGWDDEDHLAAAMWNIAALMWTEKACADSMLPWELMDLPWMIEAFDDAEDKRPCYRHKAITIDSLELGATTICGRPIGQVDYWDTNRANVECPKCKELLNAST